MGHVHWGQLHPCACHPAGSWPCHLAALHSKTTPAPGNTPWPSAACLDPGPWPSYLGAASGRLGLGQTT
eukprot:1153091-Pelagomonas_calceolata.AAC.1